MKISSAAGRQAFSCVKQAAFCTVILASAFLSPRVNAARGDLDVLVAPDRTEAGKKFVPPTAEKPLYCLIMSAGPQELGSVIANEKIPPLGQVEPLVKAALAGRHYLPVDKEHPQPDLVIVYSWGSINPEDELGTGTDELPAALSLQSKRQMLSIVSTKNVDLRMGGFERDQVMSSLGDGRYFLLLGAYDYKSLAAGTPRQKTMLWRTRLSTYNTGIGSVDLAAALPRMLEVGAKAFGLDGYPDEMTSKLKKGKVIVGEAEVKEYIVSGTTVAPMPPKAKQQSAAPEKTGGSDAQDKAPTANAK